MKEDYIGGINILEFGAKGDGVTLDTAAIQKAIDAGGMVNFPPGNYLTGTLYLKSYGGLHLEQGAILMASSDPADYNADDFCEQVLNQDPECAEAYLGKLMAELNVKKKEELKNCVQSFEHNLNYNKAVRFADSKLASELKAYITFINTRNAKQAEEARKASEFRKALEGFNTSNLSVLQKFKKRLPKLVFSDSF